MIVHAAEHAGRLASLEIVKLIAHGLKHAEDRFLSQVVETGMVHVLGQVEGEIAALACEVSRVEPRGFVEGAHSLI